MADEVAQDVQDVAEDATNENENEGGVADESTADDTTDYREKYAGQQKVNRDLERKLSEARKRADRAAELEAEIAKLQGKEAEHAEALKERERDAAALARANDRILRSEVRAAAKGVLADPADALTFLDLAQFEVDDDGNVDQAAVSAAIADLVKNKPYLSAQGERRFQGDAGGGGSRKDARPAQLTEADLDRLSDRQINEARRKGQLDDLLGRSR